MKKITKFYFLFIGMFFLLFSCSEDLNEDEELRTQNEISDNSIKKDFEISEHWFGEEIKTKSFPIGDIYNNFGEGLDCLGNNARHSVFRVDNSLEPLVATTLEEKTTFAYTATNNYLEIDDEVKKELATALGIDIWKVELDANLSVTNSSRISQDSKSIYVNVLYVKRYGKGRLQFTHPSINNYLIYPTNLHDPEGTTDGINISNLTFRNTYGDRFKSIITFGCLLSATIQITNVDFDGEQRDVVEADAKAKIGRWVETSVSWESLSTNSRHFHSSSLMIDGTIIPRGGLILNHDDLLNEIRNLDQLYANNDLGVILNAYDDYSSMYPTYNFKDYQFYMDQIEKVNKEIYYYSWLPQSLVASYITSLYEEYDKYRNMQTDLPFDENKWVSRFLSICTFCHYTGLDIPCAGEAYAIWLSYNS